MLHAKQGTARDGGVHAAVHGLATGRGVAPQAGRARAAHPGTANDDPDASSARGRRETCLGRATASSSPADASGRWSAASAASSSDVGLEEPHPAASDAADERVGEFVPGSASSRARDDERSSRRLDDHQKEDSNEIQTTHAQLDRPQTKSSTRLITVLLNC